MRVYGNHRIEFVIRYTLRRSLLLLTRNRISREGCASLRVRTYACSKPSRTIPLPSKRPNRFTRVLNGLRETSGGTRNSCNRHELVRVRNIVTGLSVRKTYTHRKEATLTSGLHTRSLARTSGAAKAAVLTATTAIAKCVGMPIVGELLDKRTAWERLAGAFGTRKNSPFYGWGKFMLRCGLCCV
jgi:hypothetical protein